VELEQPANYMPLLTARPSTARLFNSSPIQPRRCRVLLTKIALLLYTGEKFPTTEATTLFFGISKLFQNKDASLRQMVHLVIKELASSAEDTIMVTSTIMKDTGGSTDSIYRPNAIRALCRIIDVRPLSGGPHRRAGSGS
jgi:coatomer protein complex subunit gamma